MSAAMNNRRESSRLKSFLQGRIYFNNRRSSVDCLIRDLSEQGAKLKLSTSITVPEMIDLHIPVKNETYRARIQWRRGDEAGVAFVLDSVPSPSLVPGAPAVDLAPRVQRLEEDVAALRRMVKELQADRRHMQGADS